MSRGLTLRDICVELTLRNGSKKQKEFDAFIAAHQRPAPVVLRLEITRGTKTTTYKPIGDGE